VRVSAEANRLRQGYGGPPKLYAKVEASALRRIVKRSDSPGLTSSSLADRHRQRLDAASTHDRERHGLTDSVTSK